MHWREGLVAAFRLSLLAAGTIVPQLKGLDYISLSPFFISKKKYFSINCWNWPVLMILNLKIKSSPHPDYVKKDE